MTPHRMRRAFTAVLLSAGAFSALAQLAFPNKPIKLVVPFAAGSGTDTVARMLSEELQGELGQAIVVENRPAPTAPSLPISSPSRRPTAIRC